MQCMVWYGLVGLMARLMHVWSCVCVGSNEGGKNVLSDMLLVMWGSVVLEGEATERATETATRWVWVPLANEKRQGSGSPHLVTFSYKEKGI